MNIRGLFGQQKPYKMILQLEFINCVRKVINMVFSNKSNNILWKFALLMSVWMQCNNF